MEEIHRGTYDSPRMQSGSVNEEKKTAKVVAGGSGIAALCGVGALVLAILGLAGLMPFDMAAIAVIAAGAGIAFQGGAVMARYQDVIAEAEEGRKGTAEIEGGMTSEVVGGAAGIVLGILALIGIAPHPLLAVSAIVLGATLLLGSGSTYRLNDLPVTSDSHGKIRRITRYSVSGAAGADVLIGLGSVTLGILGLIGVVHSLSPILSLVAMLAVGVAVLFNGSAVGARMAAIFHH